MIFRIKEKSAALAAQRGRSPGTAGMALARITLQSGVETELYARKSWKASTITIVVIPGDPQSPLPVVRSKFVSARRQSWRYQLLHAFH